MAFGSSMQERRVGRSRVSFGAPAGSPSIDPWPAEFAGAAHGHAGRCPEIDCVRALLAADVIDAAERARPRSASAPTAC